MKKIYNAFFLVFLFSCLESKKDVEDNLFQEIEIPKLLKNNLESIDLSELIDSTRIIRLETKKECLIGYIDQVKVFRDHIFVIDSYQSKGLFEFDIGLATKYWTIK